MNIKQPLASEFRRVRSDAQIQNVKTIEEKAPELITSLGPSFPVGDLRRLFGGLDISEIAALPVVERDVYVARFLDAQDLGSNAAKASMTAALYGRLGERVIEGSSYYVQIGGQKYDRRILQGFVRATTHGSDHRVSAEEAKRTIAPAMTDGPGLTATEAKTYLFALQHFKATDKAVREQLVPALQAATGAPVKVLQNGEQGFDFGQLTDYLDKAGRLSDLYSAKTDMSSAEMLAMWNNGNGITLEQLNQHLQAGLEPRSKAEITAKFGAEDMKAVQEWLKDTQDTKTAARLATGKVSYGEFQNLIYGSWKMDNTPYTPGYASTFKPIPTHEGAIG